MSACVRATVTGDVLDNTMVQKEQAVEKQYVPPPATAAVVPINRVRLLLQEPMME